MHTVHSSGPSTCERVWQHTRIVRDAGAASATEERPSLTRGFFFAIVLILHVVSRFNARGRGTLWNPFLPSLTGRAEGARACVLSGRACARVPAVALGRVALDARREKSEISKRAPASSERG
jgi:hypothetical protein